MPVSFNPFKLKIPLFGLGTTEMLASAIDSCKFKVLSWATDPKSLITQFAGSTIMLLPINPKLLIKKSLELALMSKRMVVSCKPCLAIFRLIGLVNVGVTLGFEAVCVIRIMASLPTCFHRTE